MKANEFVKEHGWDYAIKFLNYNASIAEDRCVLDFGEYYYLKRLIKSHELVKSYGGLDAANKTICDAFHGSNHPIPEGHEKLSLAIQDVESCHVD